MTQATQACVAGSQCGPAGSPAHSASEVQPEAPPVLDDEAALVDPPALDADVLALDEAPAPELDWLAPVELTLPLPPPPLPGAISTPPQPHESTTLAMKTDPARVD
ncbi:MAG: hypothetical protein ABJE95_12510 [Byssovorax sp.]